jgi:uncharacterized protein YecE (DUF72 family)
MADRNIYLGTQGWSYKDWVGSFYPPGTQPRDYLRRYAEVFDAVELDSTFYGTPRAEMVRSWDRSTPPDFQFTAKLPRSITHDRRLVDAGDELRDFLATIEELGPKLGAVLIQLPPDLTAAERPALEAFLQGLPDGVRFAAEFRHRSWLTEETFELLRQHGVAWTAIDLSYMPRRLELTADLCYVRWLGNRKDITRLDSIQIDRRERLNDWAAKLDEVAQQVQRVYGFANNHYSGHSPSDIRYLRERLGLVQSQTGPTPRQGTLL